LTYAERTLKENRKMRELWTRTTAFLAKTGDETTWPWQEVKRWHESMKGAPKEVEVLMPSHQDLE
jgi:hypothetical protein